MDGCPKLFSEKESSDSEQLQLTLYLMDEFVKGKDSELSNYFETLPTDLQFFYYWDKTELQECQDEELLKLAEELKNEVEKQWTEMLAFLSNNSDRFKNVLKGGKQLFLMAYPWVCTRCFGYQLDFTFMSPVADCFNHNHMCETIFWMVNKKLHVDPMKDKSYFKGGKFLNNMKLIYSTNSIEDKEALKSELVEGFVVTPEYEMSQQRKSLVGWKEQIQKEVTQTWDLVFDEEDYTFEEDEEYYMKGGDAAEEEVKDECEQQEEESENAGSSEVPSDLSWTQHVSDKESYFTLTNRSGRTIKQGEEVFYFYGRMSNAFLLLNYSFAFQGNKFDSYEVSLVKEPVSRNVEDIICFDYS